VRLLIQTVKVSSSASVLPRRLAVNPVRPGREQRQRSNWVPEMSWRGS